MRTPQKRKKWEHKDVNPTTGKPILRKLHVHTGDQVIVISGADKGLISEVTYVRARPLSAAQRPRRLSFRVCSGATRTRPPRPPRARHAGHSPRMGPSPCSQHAALPPRRAG